MNAKRWVVLVLAGAISLGIWFFRASAPVVRAARAVGLRMEDSTPSTASALRAAGVHKCVGAEGTSYVDGPCPRGTREAAANGGTMTIASFPKPAPSPAALASGVLGGPLVKPMDPEERDRLRDKAIDDAANRR